MKRASVHPERASVDIPAEDGTLLRFTINLDQNTGRFTGDSRVDVGEIKEYRARPLHPLVAYYADHILKVDRTRGLGLHTAEPGLRIDGGWLTHLSDWIEMMIDASEDVWGVTK